MERLFRIDFYPQDWLVKTQGLTPEQCGFYIQIIALIYCERGALENDPYRISRLLKTSSRKARTIIAELLKIGKLQLNSDAKIIQKRAENELNIKRNHLELSAKGGRNKAENQRNLFNNNDLTSTDMANPVPSPTPTPTPTPTVDTKVSTPPTPTTTSKEEANAKPKRARRKSTHIDDKFAPDLDGLILAADLGLDIEPVVREFIDYWKSIGQPMSDWQATFRNRLRQLAKYRAERAERKNDGRRNVQDVVGATLRVIATNQ